MRMYSVSWFSLMDETKTYCSLRMVSSLFFVHKIELHRHRNRSDRSIEPNIAHAHEHTSHQSRKKTTKQNKTKISVHVSWSKSSEFTRTHSPAGPLNASTQRMNIWDIVRVCVVTECCLYGVYWLVSSVRRRYERNRVYTNSGKWNGIAVLHLPYTIHTDSDS